MCGIAGFYHKRQLDKSILKKMTDTITYRGPDDSGYFLQNCKNDWQIGLGHRRLSIIDVSPLGHQPMFSENQKIGIVFNGEIYNFNEIRDQLISMGFAFKSRSDTEVIINSYRCWGIDCIKKFNGMFAIALFDFHSETLYLIRDRIGVKPLYYYCDNNVLAFSSELKPFFEYPYFKKQLDSRALRQFLFHGYIPAPLTIFENTSKLLPGHYIEFKNGIINEKSYWSIESLLLKRSENVLNENDYCDHLESLLKDSVKLRMISDVPLGAFLSGGIDSSLVVALMRSVSTNTVKTFTIGFNEPDYDESRFARKIAEHLGTEHHELILSIEQAKQMIVDIPLYFDEPFADTSQLPTMMVSRLAREQITVALSGDAGDELFCGYDMYRAALRYEKMKKLRKYMQLINNVIPIESLIRRKKPSWTKLFFLKEEDDIIDWEYKTARCYLDPLLLEKTGYNEDRLRKVVHLGKNIQEKAMVCDLLRYLPDDILTKVDRASMSVSLEARNPLLDYRIVEYSFEIPHIYKYNNGTTKYLLRKILSKYVPNEFYERPKQGFTIPVYKWLKNELYYLVEEYCSVEFIKSQSLFDQEKIDKLIRHFNKEVGTEYFAKFVWNLIVFQMWYKTYML